MKMKLAEYILGELQKNNISEMQAKQYLEEYFSTGKGKSNSYIHPLVHINSSDLSLQRYSSIFSGDESFLEDHQVLGEKIFPGVGYLEAARVAISSAMESENKDSVSPKNMVLQDVVWAQPFFVRSSGAELNVALIAQESDEIQFEIYSMQDNNPVIHSQGCAQFVDQKKLQKLDIDLMLSQMNVGMVDAKRCYSIFNKMGLVYGKSHQAIEYISLGTHQALAKLTLPMSVKENAEQYTLHPSLMDGALQASIGVLLEPEMLTGNGKIPPPSLPFALEIIEIHHAYTDEMYAWVRFAEGSLPTAKVQKLDIDLCDVDGRICVQMKGFMSRILATQEPAISTLQVSHKWRQFNVPSHAHHDNYAQHIVVLYGFESQDHIQFIENNIPSSDCISYHSSANSIDEQFIEYSIHCFELIKDLLASKPKEKVLFQFVVPNSGERSLLAGLAGLLRTAIAENSKLVAQLIMVDTIVLDKKTSVKSLTNKLLENKKAPEQLSIKYEGELRFISSWEEYAGSNGQAIVSFKNDGVYLITGGLGGLGVIFAKAILAETTSAKIILTGRSELTEQKRALVSSLQQTTNVVEYYALDVAQGDSVKILVSHICKEYGKLDGIIHSAGINADNYIVNKVDTDYRSVLLPKVSGTSNLDLASKDQNLDFFVMFSSIASAMGNPGQSDYAAANGFMDQFSVYRNELVSSGDRSGQTLSINWPLWKDGGMGVDEATVKLVKNATGMVALQTENGLQAFHDGLYNTSSQVLVMEGVVPKLRNYVLGQPSASVSAKADSKDLYADVEAVKVKGSNEESFDLLEIVQSFLSDIVSVNLSIKSQDIDLETEFSDYGFDSVSLTGFANQLNETYEMGLTPTIFFEYSTLASLSDFLIDEYKDLLSGKFSTPTNTGSAHTGIETKETLASHTPKNYDLPKLISKRFQRRMPKQATTSGYSADLTSGPSSTGSSIAVIGMSACFPGAENVDQFWDNLMAEKESISEIPLDRWDWNAIYGDPKLEDNKTNIKWGGFLESVSNFDPLFFGISPREAELMDPQQRLLMMHTYKVIEDSGYSPESLSGSNTGIFVGTASSGYGYAISHAGVPVEGYSSTGAVPSVGPNRMSYFLNLHGPSEPIETACSSSLVAIHRAIGAIQQGDCNAAIVGGVNTIITSEAHISFSKAGMLCGDGHCKTFSSDANGYVRGEGVGMLFLKTLVQAELDGDHIYGVIQGSAENHGGRANSLTAPNPKAQAAVLKSAYEKSGFDPSTISYIEAHGTGTELGDPIEINGLKTAFKELYQQTENGAPKRAHCGIGSVKTNIGHLELAAGVAGIIKVLLQFKHQTLVKTLHCKNINPYIDLENSPFYIVQETKEWSALKDDLGGDIKRRAGVSSFGFGGANAHVVLEEYIPQASNNTTDQTEPVAIILSARTPEQLISRVSDLESFIQNHPSELDLHALSYTLQVGRDAMDERLGFIVENQGELEQYLGEYLTGSTSVKGMLSGDVKRVKEVLNTLKSDKELQNNVPNLLKNKDYKALIELWVKGYILDWQACYGELKPRRISLPSYRFSQDKYWIPKVRRNRRVMSSSTSVIHPMIHENTSDLSEQRFTSTFTGAEFFLNDHRVNGDRVLPGVAYLEMACVAIEKSIAMNASESEGKINSLFFENIVWIEPFFVDDSGRQVQISLCEEPSGSVKIEFYSGLENDNELTVHSQGYFKLQTFDSIPKLNLEILINQMDQGYLSGEHCYKVFNSVGLDYGVTHQGIDKIYLGKDQVLAKLKLPDEVESTQHEFTLHPSLLDSALQSSIGLVEELNNEGGFSGELELRLPFALDSVNITGSCSSNMYAWIRFSKGSMATDEIHKLDIDICDERGSVCVAMRGFSTRKIRKEQNAVVKAISVWNEVPAFTNDVSQNFESRYVVLCDIPAYKNHIVGEPSVELLDAIAEVITFSFDSELAPLASQFTEYAVRCFELIQTVLTKQTGGKTLIQVVIPDSFEYSIFLAISAMFKTANLENPNIIGQVLELNSDTDFAYIESKLQENKYSGLDSVIRYKDNDRYVLMLEEFEMISQQAPHTFKNNGVYLITGGMGGLGVLFAREILAKTVGSTVILTGRSSLEDSKQALLKELNEFDGTVEYYVVDISDHAQTNSLVKMIESQHGKLNGVILSAGIVKDNFIINKTPQELRQVLAPKVAGTINLDIATSNIALDFFVMFSSISSLVGNPGQSDYAIANGFMDQYSAYRHHMVVAKKRHGTTVSINWPLWKEGGMSVDPAKEALLKSTLGLTPMQTETGLNTFYKALSNGHSHVLVVEGSLSKIRSSLFKKPAIQIDQTSLNENRLSDDVLNEEVLNEEVLNEDRNDVESTIPAANLNIKAEQYLRKLLSSVLKMSPNQIDVNAPLEKYGMDSILVMKLTSELEKTFGPLPKTLFFEYQTISELTTHLLKQFGQIFTGILGRDLELNHKINHISVTENKSSTQSIVDKKNKRLSRKDTTSQRVSIGEFSEIAIIGLSGRYPQSSNLDEYWDNLREGRNCVTEVPKNRWDWRDYYTDDRSLEGHHFSKYGGFIEGVDEFDPLFFNISPRDAVLMDPQERLFLEHAYMATEDAGYTREQMQTIENSASNGKHEFKDLNGQVGVYAGVMYGEYQLLGAESSMKGKRMGFSSSLASIANRVSYVFNLHGPSISTDSMCSSSLTSIHLACQDLKLGRTDMAIAGGVNVTIHPNKYLLLSAGQFISTKGACESFGEGGDGYIPAEGVGTVILKRLEEAERDGDNIYGVITGSAINHGGKTNGFTVPNPKAQRSVVERALLDSNIDPRWVSYLEAHGTGTKLGDPIEISALSQVFGRNTEDRGFCRIGSVKSNIGHCEGAAGISGLSKVLLQMKYRKIVPSIHSSTLNPNIDFESTPFVVNQELKEWNRPVIDGHEIPRIAGISSFGAGGSNAHLIIKEYEKQPSSNVLTVPEGVIIPISARAKEQLFENARKLLTFLQKDTSNTVENSEGLNKIDLIELAYTLQVGREAMEERAGFIVTSLDDLMQKLELFVSGKKHIDDCYQGTAKQSKETLSVLFADDEITEAIDKWMTKKKYEKLLELWTKGFHLDWQKMYGNAKPNRMSLPSYSFVKERYWVSIDSHVTLSEEYQSLTVDNAAEKVRINNKKSVSQANNLSERTDEEMYGKSNAEERDLESYLVDILLEEFDRS
jgi:polyketide synthase PksN